MSNKYIRVILILIILLVLVVPVFSDIETNEVACLSLSFDDSLKSHYTIVYPLLKEKGFGATFFVVTNVSKDPFGRDLMTKEQIKELSNNGFEIGSHTISHPFLTRLSEKEAEKQIKESKRILEQDYGVVVNLLAFPYRDYNDKVIEITQKYYLNARAIYNRKPVGFLINSYSLQNNTDPRDVCNYIKHAQKNKLWLVLVLHDIIENSTVWDTSIKDFEKILECAEETNILVDSISGCKAKSS